MSTSQSTKGVSERIQVRSLLIIVSVILLLSAVRVPYLMTHHVQEDAYIHFQHMQSLADTGEFGFNPGERVNGSTSTLYVLLFTPLFVLFNGSAIPLILLVNVFILNAALFLIITLFMQDTSLPYRLYAFALVSLLPVSLITSFTGMETAILVGAYILLLYDLSQPRRTPVGVLALIALPWIRIDSIAFAGLYLLALWFIDRRRSVTMGVIYSTSLVVMLLGFLGYFGQILPQTVIGKSITYDVSATTLQNRLDNGFKALSQVLLPIHSRFLTDFNVMWFVALFVGVLFVLVHGWQTRYRAAYIVIVSHAVIVPTIYGLSGSTLFKWYTWPSSILLLTAVIVLGIQSILAYLERRSVRIGLFAATAAVVIALAGAQLIASLAAGTKDYDYRRSIGLWIRENSQPGSSIFLEPIGYIGYAAQRYVHDSVGLVSPQTTAYRTEHGADWLLAYLSDYRPAFLVYRKHNLRKLRESSQAMELFLANNYLTVKRFSFTAEDYASNSLERRLLGLVDTYDYHVLRLKDSNS